MEAPPLSAAPPIPTPVSPAAAVVYPPSVDSSPRSRHNESWDAEPPPHQAQPKLRLMCSYGGHIVPRPHDKTLCYIGGDTRIVVIDRQTTLSDLHQRLSKNLLQNQPFSLKYQLPTEDLDSLISVSTDEDLENMVEEYDRLSNGVGAAKSGRLRLFLFPKSFSGIEQLLLETASIKSEDWFFDTLNGKSSLSVAATDHEFSETSSVNCLLGLDDDSMGKVAVVEKDVEAQIEASKIGGNNGNRNLNVHCVAIHDVQSVPDSPMLETTSSFGSASSSPFVANLPPIRVRAGGSPKIGGLGIEDQFQQMSVGVAGHVNFPQPPKQEEVGGVSGAGFTPGAAIPGFPVVTASDYASRVISDDERSDHSGSRKLQHIHQQVHDQLQSQQIPQYQQKQSSAFDLPSPDSASSEGSATNPLSRQRQAIYHQEPLMQVHSGNTRMPSNQADLNTVDQNKSKVQMAEESGYMFSGQYEQNRPHLHQPQQFIHTGNQYIPAGAVPIASYYPMYHSQPQPQHHQPHPMLDQQYPIYLLSARQNQSYNSPAQHPSYGELAPNAPSRSSQMPPVSAAPQPAYNQVRSVPSSNPEKPGDIYRTAASQLVQVPSGHHQDAANPQMYYTPLPPQLAAQYQTLATAPAMMMPDGSAQFSTENVKQQFGNSQP
ncbi:uncharacterized protein LOC127261133 isoform X2 [Andrographis paniculata]|uniref:uncharacterized protein LOC127261133 isoform X2 n=1 Tax=Andrographis paniculata TaxID=175694 RepID=UPI0021E8F674|nr:uncharacterized protein LOC127261133 isoform X2 [Andrographis paniculata]